MIEGGGHRRRQVHPGAWWIWAIALAVSISTTTNPVLLLLVASTVVVTVLSRRPHAPWARSLRLYAALGVFIVVSRVLLHVLVGLKTHDTVILPLPSVHLPEWAKGLTLLGPVGVGGLVGAALEGARLATMLLCFGAANALGNPRRLLASTPTAVKDIGTASVIALAVAPQLVESVQRVSRARVLRGGVSGRARVMQTTAPVLHDTLDRSIALAASMDVRGYGRRIELPRGMRVLTAVLTLGGSLLTCLGVYGTLQGRDDQTGAPWWTSAPVLVLGLFACVAGVVLMGRATKRTRYRPDPWGLLEWAVSAGGVLTLLAVRQVLHDNPLAQVTSIDPLTMPQVPFVLPLCVIPALLPAFFTPVPVRARRQVSLRARRAADANHGIERDVAALRGAIR